ncbi:MAG: hypothetical protein U5K33_01910 [Halofilum sp. (in: g-proteobacteria)]|nr:hypothetical protein [Halofilum sp. (in: g-proteobacteria)]
MAEKAEDKRKSRETEIEEFYVRIGLGDEKYRQYMINLSYGSVAYPDNEKQVVFIEAGSSSSEFEVKDNA